MIDAEHGCWEPGKDGVSVHQGDPLTVDQILELPDGAEVVITWEGGNGPFPYRVLVDFCGERRVENPDPTLLICPGQRIPLHRVTLGWGDGDREFKDGMYMAPHIRAEWARLRGQTAEVPAG
jgi:hypothetical protein